MNKLQQLKDLLESGQENFHLAQELEHYFLGTKTGCKCKYSNIISQLNHYWNTQGKQAYESENQA